MELKNLVSSRATTTSNKHPRSLCVMGVGPNVLKYSMSWSSEGSS